MKLSKILGFAGSAVGLAVLGIAATGIIKGNWEFIHYAKGASGISTRAAPGYSVSVFQERLFGLPIKKELSIKTGEDNLHIYGASAVSHGMMRWNTISNNLPQTREGVFRDPSKLFNDYWKEVFD